MSKIRGLYYIQQALTQERQALAHRLNCALQRGQSESQMTGSLRRLGELTLAEAECARLGRSLTHLHELADHGAGGSVPDWYDGHAYGPEWVAFDAYTEMGYALAEPMPFSIRKLSSLLLRLGDELAGRHWSLMQDYLESAESMIIYDEQADENRVLSQAEMITHCQANMLAAMEQTMFIQTWADDLSALSDLVLARGDMAQALNLIGPLPELPF